MAVFTAPPSPLSPFTLPPRFVRLMCGGYVFKWRLVATERIVFNLSAQENCYLQEKVFPLFQ